MKSIQGIVVSLKAQQTAKVEVTSMMAHPIYKKLVKKTKAYACHYENLDLAEGDEVVIAPTRPVSKTKRFKVVSKVGGAQ